MKSTRTSPLLLLALALGLSSCGTARYVTIEKERGTVAITYNTAKLRQKAVELIAMQCPRGYETVREEEVVIGSIVRTDTDIDTGSDGTDVDVSSRTRTYTRTEWRIHYQCQ